MDVDVQTKVDMVEKVVDVANDLQEEVVHRHQHNKNSFTFLNCVGFYHK